MLAPAHQEDFPSPNVTSLNGKQVQLVKSASGGYAVAVNSVVVANITSANHLFSNAVVHIIDGVLYTPNGAFALHAHYRWAMLVPLVLTLIL